jgi:hypothetical protein
MFRLAMVLSGFGRPDAAPERNAATMTKSIARRSVNELVSYGGLQDRTSATPDEKGNSLPRMLALSFTIFSRLTPNGEGISDVDVGIVKKNVAILATTAEHANRISSYMNDR